MLARIPINGVAVRSCWVVDRLGVVSMRRVAELVHDVASACAPSIRLDKLTTMVVVPLLLCRL